MSSNPETDPPENAGSIDSPVDELSQPEPSSHSEAAEQHEPNWPTDPESRMQRLEAVMLMAREPLPSRKISQLAGLEDGTQARTMIGKLNRQYDQVGRAFNIKRVAGGYRMLSRPQFSSWIRRLEHVPRPTRLSGPMLETVTVVAYRQPIMKADIEAIRGVSCGEILRQLLERGLVKIAGRSPELGRPFLYATTKAFLSTFGFNSLEDLPRADRLSGEGLPNWVTSDDNSMRPNSEQVSNPLAAEVDAAQIDPETDATFDSSAKEDCK